MATPDLAGLLTNAPRQAKPPQSPALASTAGVDTDAAEGGPPRQRAVRSETTPDSPPAVTGPGRRQYLRSITIYLPRSVHEQLATAAAARGTTRTALLLIAISATHAELGPALAEQRGSEAQKGLFEIPQHRRVAEPAVQTTIRVTDSQLEAIEDLGRKYEASRSGLVVAALRLFLAVGEMG